ncbi:hypothetical protein NA56DRAFT_699382 [Hyaloscypha hepaticicola]|uniref:Uncharacterized protein n=1 Tax=Hyaloscypha hepaticicola TaxID=2082293 RepID=A0A2J6QGQ6_9HELO|nr:hypothetical protein NA56DRAFT_699382 [Hyaloscypha hepaticicola]
MASSANSDRRSLPISFLVRAAARSPTVFVGRVTHPASSFIGIGYASDSMTKHAQVASRLLKAIPRNYLKVSIAFASAGVALQPIPATPAISAHYQVSEPASYFVSGACLGLTSIEVSATLLSLLTFKHQEYEKRSKIQKKKSQVLSIIRIVECALIHKTLDRSDIFAAAKNAKCAHLQCLIRPQASRHYCNRFGARSENGIRSLHKKRDGSTLRTHSRFTRVPLLASHDLGNLILAIKT